MPSYLSPAVYVEEVSSGSKPIAGAATSVGAFVGIAERGEMGKAVLVTNWSQFVKEFGSFIPNGKLAYGVYGFYAEGGSSCYVVRTCHYTDITKAATKTSLAAVNSLKDGATVPQPTIRVTAPSDGTWGNNISVTAAKATDVTDGFMLIVNYKQGGKDIEVERFDNLTMKDGSLVQEDLINKASNYIRVVTQWNEGTTVVGSKALPKVDPAQTITLAGGNDGITNTDGTSSLVSVDFVGDASETALNGLHAFDTVDINILAVPDMAGDAGFIGKGLEYCKNRKDCFFIADCPQNNTPSDVKRFRGGDNPFNSSYGALYYPWVTIIDPLNGKKKSIPPSGVVAGTYAYTDSTRGVHKAPAGISEGYLDSVVGVERILTKGEHDMLNPYPVQINAIRSLPAGICIWGARTLSMDTEWAYVNVRRLFLYLEKSIELGTQWVVFEPNDPSLWSSVKRNLTAFLTRVWRDGALFGGTPEEAFFVKVDEENNPPEVRDAGQLIIEVGVAPVKPAEFVIIRISQKTLSK